MKNSGIIFNKLRTIGLAALAVMLIVISIVPGCAPINHLPEIVSLEAGAEVIDPSNNCLIECLAWDQDGDELAYNWTATEGKIAQMDDKGARIVWNAPDDEGLYTITVMVQDGRNGNDMQVSDTITIRVKNNHEPVITELVADTESVLFSGSSQITCAAEDEDGDELNYKWTAVQGKISGTGHTIEWTAPARSGLYEIVAVVSDGYGKEDTRSISISVSEYMAPVITELMVTPEAPQYFKEKNGKYMILKDRKCTIECVIVDPYEGLVYEWSDGKNTYTGPGSENKTKFAGEGSTVTWTAPKTAGDVTITVSVKDEAGNTASKSITFQVETCGCKF